LETDKNIDTLTSLTYEWARLHESNILANGIKLSPDQEIDAFLAGVKNPSDIKLLKVNQIPLPDSPLLVKGLEQIGLLNNDTVGLTLGHGIYINKTHWDRREVLVHEFAHVMQFERLGFRQFLLQYITECLSYGYPFGDLETEARKIEKAICGPKI
jgi:hypothetical protein